MTNRRGRLRDFMGWPRTVEAHAPLARALREHHRTGRPQRVRALRGEGFEYEIETEDFFGLEGHQAPIDHAALDRCRGRVLDLGAGTGRHALALQARGVDVCALDVSPVCVELMRDRGVVDVRLGDVSELGFAERDQFDTALLAMQSVGIVGSLAGLEVLLHALDRCLRPGGQILLDSSAPLPIDGDSAKAPRPEEWAEVDVAFRYRNWRGQPFRWLYLGANALALEAEHAGWQCEVCEQVEEGPEYLARLTRRGQPLAGRMGSREHGLG